MKNIEPSYLREVATMNEPQKPRAVGVLDRYLSQSDIQRGALISQIDALDEDGLACYGYAFYHLNCASIFGSRVDNLGLRRMAADAVRARLRAEWDFYSSLELLSRRGAVDCASLAPLEGVDAASIRSVLEHNGGLIICSYHYGPYRFLASALVQAGLKVVCCLDEKTFHQTRPFQERLRNATNVDTADLRLVNVEETGGTFHVLHALRNNAVVLLFVDGNTGQDGAGGTSSRLKLRFLDLPVRVKTGAARLATLAHVPILPLLTVPSGTTGYVVADNLLLPPERRVRSRQFERVCMQSLYRFLEFHVLQAPQHWEMLRYLHRWREVPSMDVSRFRKTELDAVRRTLERGTSFHLKKSLLIPVGTSRMGAWVNPQNLRSYSQKGGTDIFAALSSAQGVDWKWLQMHCGERGMMNALGLLSHLQRSGVLAALRQKTSSGRQKEASLWKGA